MKQAEVLQRLQNGEDIIVSQGLNSTAQIGGDTVNYSTFLSFLKRNIIELRANKNLSMLEYYTLKK